MNTLFLLDMQYIVMIAAGGAFLLFVLVLLYFTVFSHAHLKKQARDLCGKFEREHALLFGQDSQYIRRLEQISSMNLIYAQQYMDWNKRFKDVRDVSDASAQACVNQLKDDLSERKYKELKNYLPIAKKAIDDYEEQVDSLSENLKNKFRDEEDCRTLALQQKENYRKVKQDYYARQTDMALVSQTFETLFSKLNSFFDEAEQDIENARYPDAKSLLQDKIGPVVSQVGLVLQSLPNICILISSVLPDKIASLNSHYEEMIQAGYPLHHIILKGDMENMNQELAHLSEKVKALSLNGVSEELETMQKRIDSFLDSFQKEKEARTVFESEQKGIYDVEKSLENQFINLCHALPEVRSIFLLGADDQTKLDGIQNTINKAGASKRSLDTYVHSATKQPYSILVQKMHTLRDQDAEAGKAIADFQSYLVSLKNDSEAANAALSVYYNRARNAERSLRKSGLISLQNKYAAIIDTIYTDVDALHADLANTPIDVGKVNDGLSKLRNEADAAFKEIETALADLGKAESDILIANRKRRETAEINAALLQAENLFYSANFKQATDLVASTGDSLKEER